MQKIILEGQVVCDKEDGGQALIATLDKSDVCETDEDTGLFVRIQSWDHTCEHKTMRTIEGKKVRVTIELID